MTNAPVWQVFEDCLGLLGRDGEEEVAGLTTP